MQAIAEQQPEQFFVSSPRLFIVQDTFMPPAKKRDLPWPFLGAILTVTVVIVLAIIGAVHTIDGEIASKFGSLDSRSTALETQIRNSDIPGNFAKLNEKTGNSETEISKLR